MKEFVNNFRGHTERLLCKGDEYLVFDRYHEYRTKSVTRGARITEAGRIRILPGQGHVATGIGSRRLR